MKKLLLAFFIMFPVLTLANIIKKPVQCFTTENLLSTLDSVHNEKVDFYHINAANDNKSVIVMFRNKESGTWTIVEIINEYSCVLATGKENII